MVWVIAFGELFFGDLWCVVWGYGGMRTHFSLLNPLPLPWVKQEKCCPAGVLAGRFSNSASSAEQLARLNAMDGQPMTAPRISV